MNFVEFVPQQDKSHALLDAIVGPLGKLIDKIVPDPRARGAAKLVLLKLQGDQEAAQIAQQIQAIIAEANSHDLWSSRAPPSFLYVMYALMLWSVPMGLIAAVDLSKANAIAVRMTSHFRALLEELYALFGTGYLGYTAAHTWGKVKGAER